MIIRKERNVYMIIIAFHCSFSLSKSKLNLKLIFTKKFKSLRSIWKVLLY